MNKDELGNEIARTMTSLDGLNRAKAPFDFYATLEKRLSFVNQVSEKWLNLFKVGIAATMLLTAFEGYLFFNSNQSDPVTMNDFTIEYLSDKTAINLYDYE